MTVVNGTPGFWGVALSNVIVNILSRMPKSIISSFINVVIFLPLCGVFIVLIEIIILFNIHSLFI